MKKMKYNWQVGIMAIGMVLGSGLMARDTHAKSDRLVNQKRLDARNQAMINSVDIIGGTPEQPYELVQAITAYDVFTTKDEQVVALLRREAARLKATALIDVVCKSEYWRFKTCTAKAIRWKKD